MIISTGACWNRPAEEKITGQIEARFRNPPAALKDVEKQIGIQTYRAVQKRLMNQVDHQ